MTDTATQTFLDLTIEELVAATRLVEAPPPAQLFSGFTPPDESVLEQMEGIGRRSLRARGFLDTTAEGALTLDENVAVIGDLLGAHGLFALAVNGGAEESLSWVLADDSQAAVLTGIDKGLWRLRFITPETVVSSLLLLVDLDEQAEGPAGRAPALSVPLPLPPGEESHLAAHERAKLAVESTTEEDTARIEALVGTAPELHSIILGFRKDDDSVHQGVVTWTSDASTGCTLIDVRDDSVELTPTTPDQIAASVYDLVAE